MKLPSLLVSVLFVAGLAGVNAVIQYFNVGGEGAEYVFSAVIVAVLTAVGRYLQEQKAASDIGEVTTAKVQTADGNVRTRSVVTPKTVEPINPIQEALLG